MVQAHQTTMEVARRLTSVSATRGAANRGSGTEKTLRRAVLLASAPAWPPRSEARERTRPRLGRARGDRAPGRLPGRRPMGRRDCIRWILAPRAYPVRRPRTVA